MLWTLDFDDYLGEFCNEGAFPLANAIKFAFNEFTTSLTWQLKGTSHSSIEKTKSSSASVTKTITTTIETTSVLKINTTIVVTDPAKAPKETKVITVDTSQMTDKVKEMGSTESAEHSSSPTSRTEPLQKKAFFVIFLFIFFNF